MNLVTQTRGSDVKMFCLRSSFKRCQFEDYKDKETQISGQTQTSSFRVKWYLDLFWTEEGGGPGPPQQLTETVFVVLLQETTLERPQPVGVVHLDKKNK